MYETHCVSLFAAKGQSPDRTILVNVMIDAELCSSAKVMTLEEREKVEVCSLFNMLEEIDSRKLKVTVYFTGEFVSQSTVSSSYKSYVTLVGSKPNHELAMHGMATGDILRFMSYEQQLLTLTKAKNLIEGAYIRGRNPQKVKGFRPQYFNQNEATYRALDEMGIEYNSGYKAGSVYEQGHKNDTWPYIVKNHTFYAVPVSTHNIAGKLVYTCDLCSKQLYGLNGSQWYDLIKSKFEECAKRREPMVILFHNLISGDDKEYMVAFRKFIDYAVSKNAAFVTTLELVEMAKTGSFDALK